MRRDWTVAVVKVKVFCGDHAAILGYFRKLIIWPGKYQAAQTLSTEKYHLTRKDFLGFCCKRKGDSMEWKEIATAPKDGQSV
jgi:hypothetical protein